MASAQQWLVQIPELLVTAGLAMIAAASLIGSVMSVCVSTRRPGFRGWALRLEVGEGRC